MKFIFFFIFFISAFSHAENSPEFNRARKAQLIGLEQVKNNQLEEALISFKECSYFFKDCIHNVGGVYKYLGDQEKSVEWFTLAARYGFKGSIDYLRENNLPIPDNDLQKEYITKNNTRNDDVSSQGLWNAINTLLNSYNRNAESQLQNRRKNTACTPVGNSIDCYDY